MTSLLLNYEQLYSQTSKLSKKLPTSDPLLSVLQEKFFILVGNQPGSLYLTEDYVNSPQSSFINDELTKLSLLATTLGINTELFTGFGPAGPQNMTSPQFPSGSISNNDYIYSNHFASNYSYSVTLPGNNGSYANLIDSFRIGIRSGYINDSGTNQIFLLSNYFTNSYLRQVSFTLYYRSNSNTTVIGHIMPIVLSDGKAITINICNDSQGISFLVNGHDYFGHITSSMVGFDVTQPMGFYATPKDTTANDNCIFVTGYTNNIFPYIPTIIAIQGTASYTNSNLSISGGHGDNAVIIPATSNATIRTPVTNATSYNIGFRTSLTGGNRAYMYISGTYQFQIHYNDENATYDSGLTYAEGHTFHIILNGSTFLFLVNGTNLLASASSFNYIFTNAFGPQSLFFFIENTGSGTQLYLPGFSYNYDYNPYNIGPEFITNGQYTTLTNETGQLVFGINATKNTDYCISSSAYTYSTYTIVLDPQTDYSSPILFGLRSAQFGVSSPSLCFVKVWQRTVYAASGGHENVTTINTFVNTVNAGYISNGQIQFENPPQNRTITITKGADDILFELSDHGLLATLIYTDLNNSQYSGPMFFYATPNSPVTSETSITISSSGLSN